MGAAADRQIPDPAELAALMALANAASPKADWCRSFGVEITEADWPCPSLPPVLLADRGELLGPPEDTLIQRFGGRVDGGCLRWLPVLRPRMRRWGTSQGQHGDE